MGVSWEGQTVVADTRIKNSGQVCAFSSYIWKSKFLQLSLNFLSYYSQAPVVKRWIGLYTGQITFKGKPTRCMHYPVDGDSSGG